MKGKRTVSKPPSATYTKLEAATACLVEAIRLYFGDGPLGPVLLLAGSAREVVTTLAEKQGHSTFLQHMAQQWQKTNEEVRKLAHDEVNFFKHADRNPTAALTVEDHHVRAVIMVACQEMQQVANPIPDEVEIFQIWVWMMDRDNLRVELREQVLSPWEDVYPDDFPSLPLQAQKSVGVELLARLKESP